MTTLVTPENFVRAESDMYFASLVQEGAFGSLQHFRELAPVDEQTVIRSNRDTLYSTGVFDLHAGPLQITMPEVGDRFMSLMIIDEDEYVIDVVYEPGTYTLTQDRSSTRYVLVGIRTFVHPQDPADVRAATKAQDAISVRQPKRGDFDIPEWDPDTRLRIHNALLEMGTTVPDTRHMFGRRNEVDPLRHLIGAALGWGGNPEHDALYLNVTPPANDGTTVHRLVVPPNVPVDAFWSVSVYNAAGYFEPNPLDRYSLNSHTAQRDADGSVEIQFGGCVAGVDNCLPIVAGWNYMVRLYRPREELIDGSWTFPEAQPI